MVRFIDRREAGARLAARLAPYADRRDVTVLGLPRGGIPVAYEVARALHVPLEAFVVRKLGLPGHEELAMGAIASGGVRVLDDAIIRMADVSPLALADVTSAELSELARRERRYRGGARFPALGGRTVIVVDDGIATGASVVAAVRALRAQHPARIVVAVPVAPSASCGRLRREADECICLAEPEPFFSVGAWYDDFGQTGDDEVEALLAAARRA